MAAKIRLQRIGAKKNAFYRIVVADTSKAPSGSVIEYLGTYDPHADPPDVKIDIQKVAEWMAKGVNPTPKTAAIIKRAGKKTAARE
ncbi:30S ribosomal protein S16 [bacterium]|nr:30S ribosomal protein S16 [candidate division CSSED10-310 bacterium]